MTTTEYRVTAFDAPNDDVSVHNADRCQYFANKRDAMQMAKGLNELGWCRIYVDRLTVETIAAYEYDGELAL